MADVPEVAQFVSTPLKGEVSAALLLPPKAKAILAYAHGAGAGIHHTFMRDSARRLALRGIATLRYMFPYMDAGRRPPDRPPVLVDAVGAAVKRSAELAGGLPVFAGGKSMGGRMSSTAASEGLIPDARGLVFFGFPLHPPGRPSIDRAEHLSGVEAPMLFLQGTRDRLADLDLLEPIVADLDRATLHVVEGADHSFHVLKRSGRTDDEVLDELADGAARWIESVLDGDPR